MLQSGLIDDIDLSSRSREGSQDILQVLWNWKWLLLLGGCVGISGGFLHFSRQAPTYKSEALVQVVYPGLESSTADTLGSPDGIRGQSRLDESRIIKSALVIDEAIASGQLQHHPALAKMSAVELRDWILSPSHLSVEPAGRDNSTALIEISFVCTDAELAQQVVDAVIAGYDRYLEAAYQNLDNEVVNVVTQAQENLRISYEGLAEKHAKFRREAPMIWLGEEARNQFAENAIEVNAAINQIQIEIRKLQATLAHVRKAEVEERPAEAILLMLANDVGLQQEFDPPSVTGPTASSAAEALPFTSAERRGVLMELQLKRQELLDAYGEQHPSVAAIQRRIELIQAQVDTLTDSERKLEAERAQNRSSIALQDMAPSEKLDLWRKSLEERLASLSGQERSLAELAEDNNQKSKELEVYLTTNRLLNGEMASVQSLLSGYTDTLKRIQVMPKSERRSLTTLTAASVGTFDGPSLSPYVLGGMALGVLSIAGLAVLLDFLDKSFRSPEDVQALLGMAVLGHVPQMSLKKSEAATPDGSICTIGGCQAGNEAFRSIRTSLFFNGNASENRVIQVTSPVPGDGKSTVSANLAVAIAQSGKSVLLIDADMRRPRIAKLFGTNVTVGLGDILAGDLRLEEVLTSSTVPNLSIIASSQDVRNPSELLTHDNFSKLLKRVREDFDFVIIDTPPVLAVADAAAVAARVDSVLLTVRLRRDAKPTAVQASRVLESVGARNLGVVVNGVSARSSYDYRYSNYGYGKPSTGGSTGGFVKDAAASTVSAHGPNTTVDHKVPSGFESQQSSLVVTRPR
ncbi:MAG: polysaccharide biosynthesis tyrosine autokinase [Pirellulaceae bacterium]